MKKLIALLSCLCMFLSVCALGEEHLSNGWRYKELEDGTVAITGYNGSDTKLTIPDKLDGCTVTAIAERAFYWNRTLKEVTLPDTVTAIERQAFGYCDQLEKVKLSANLVKLGDLAFYDNYELKKLQLPKTLTDCGVNPFMGCTALSELTLAKGNPVLEMKDGVLFDKEEKTLICYPAAVNKKTYKVPA